MKTIAEAMKAYLETYPFDPGDDDCATVLDQLYRAYAESHENDPPEIQAGYAELETFLESLPLDDNSISAAASASPTNTKPSSMACSTARR